MATKKKTYYLFGGETPSIVLMNYSSGWDDFVCINEDEYQILVDLQ
jgi:hypothetical protein